MDRGTWEKFYEDIVLDYPGLALLIWGGGPILIILGLAVPFVTANITCGVVMLVFGILLLSIAFHWYYIKSQKGSGGGHISQGTYGGTYYQHPQYGQPGPPQYPGAHGHSTSSGYPGQYTGQPDGHQRQYFFPATYYVCQWCGTPITPGYPYCPRCGRPFQPPRPIEVEYR